MEDKQDIVRRLKILLVATRAGSDISDLILNDNQDQVAIKFKNGGVRLVDIAGDSGIAIIKDVVKRL